MKKGLLKRISFVVLAVCFVVIIFLLIKEQLRGAALSSAENMLLSITYLVVAVALILLFRIKNIEDKEKEGHRKK